MLHKSVLYLIWLIFILPIFAERVDVNTFVEKFAEHPEFFCSLSIDEITPVDTIHYSGFLAIGKNKFYANIGDDYYLQVDTIEMLTWSDGADAYPVDGLPFFDLHELKNKLAQKFDITVENNGNGNCIIGERYNDDVPVKSFELCVDRKFFPKKLKIIYSRGNIVNIHFFSISFKKSVDTLFELPKGVGIVR